MMKLASEIHKMPRKSGLLLISKTCKENYKFLNLKLKKFKLQHVR